jgi:oligosaccharide repeat unit polymerase
MTFLNIIFASTSALFILFIVFYGFRHSLFNLTAPFAGLALIDIYFPAFFWSTQDNIKNYPFADAIYDHDIASGLLFYTFFYIIFFLTILMTSRARTPSIKLPLNLNILKKRLFYVTLLFGFLSFLSLAIEVSSMGGTVLWLASKFVRTKEWISEPSGISAMLLLIQSSYIFQSLAGLGFSLRKSKMYTKSFTYFFPALALFFALLSFLRGTILIFLFTFLFAELFRIKFIKTTTIVRPKKKSSYKKLWSYSLAGLFFVFVVYGGIRDNLRAEQAGIESTRSFNLIPSFLDDGHGLISLTNIMSHYADSDERLLGQTYFDMLLLPIPRVIYTSKPISYGVDDIALGMGWPSSNQAAATMPGEAYANFGALGLLMALIIGFILGRFRSFIFRNPIQFLILGPVMFVTIPVSMNWMSFTGLMNNLKFILILSVICWTLEHRVKFFKNSIKIIRLK